jgi:hypothetical protein
MPEMIVPRTPVENWEQVRDEWVAAVTALVAQIESWAQGTDWATRQYPKSITEDRLGTYTVPQLLTQLPQFKENWNDSERVFRRKSGNANAPFVQLAV